MKGLDIFHDDVVFEFDNENLDSPANYLKYC